jgi:two-component system, NarL family, response regulator DesR
MIRIGIAEDQALVRESLAIVLGLEPDLRVCWTATNGAEAVECALQTEVDMILMDLRMPGMDGVAAMKHIRQGNPAPYMVVLTTFHHDEWIVDALQAGADACFLKEIPPKLLVEAIRRIYSGQWTPSEWADDWRLYAPEIQFQSRVGHVAPGGLGQETLTTREIEVLRKLCDGLTNAEIAATMYLSEGTVKNYVSTLYDKLGVRHRAGAIRMARERGLG